VSNAQKAAFVKRTKSKLNRVSTRKRLIRFGLVSLNVAILGVVAAVVLVNPSSGHVEQSSAAVASASEIANPLDQLASANIALTVARMSNLAETTAVTNQADSQSTELTMAATSSNVIAKPQVVTTSFKSNKDIVEHKVVAGETVSSLATQYGVTSDSIRWSNGLSGNALTVGKVLLIPPVNGIVHKVVAGETADSLAKKYSSDRDKLIAFNFAETSGLQPGELIVIPNGSVAAVVARAASSYSFGWGSAQYGYNGYDYGYCTWWVAHLRAQAGNPLPSNLGNASTWGIRAKAYGLPTGTTPRVGAAVVTSTRGAGHVGYVTAVNADGSFVMSEMNHLGWNRTDTRTMTNAGYTFIY
jgi:surface antigen